MWLSGHWAAMSRMRRLASATPSAARAKSSDAGCLTASTSMLDGLVRARSASTEPCPTAPMPGGLECSAGEEDLNPASLGIHDASSRRSLTPHPARRKAKGENLELAVVLGGPPADEVAALPASHRGVARRRASAAVGPIAMQACVPFGVGSFRRAFHAACVTAPIALSAITQIGPSRSVGGHGYLPVATTGTQLRFVETWCAAFRAKAATLRVFGGYGSPIVAFAPGV